MSYGGDVVVLLIVAAIALAIAVWQLYRLDRVLRDPDHPDHEDAKAAVKASMEQAERDRLRLP